MISAPPKLRTDLIITRHEQRGDGPGAPFVIKDPACGRFFSFREAEHFIAMRLDGTAPLDEVRRKAEDALGARLDASSLQQFVERLSRLGLLEQNERPDIAAPAARQRVESRSGGQSTGGPHTGIAAIGGARRSKRIQGNLLYMRWRAIDPDRLLGRMVDRVSWLFTSWFVIVSAALIGIAMIISVVNSGEIGQHVSRHLRFDTFVMAWIVLVAVIVLHEFAHGMTCKHFGGSVHEIGFMLLFFQPAMYCNVSDAWLFPQKSRRLWVTFAGAYFEMFLWALATLAWRVTDPRTTLNYLAFIVMVTSGIKTLFNLNPLIKLDGYYLLSDYLEIPNLRQRAFGHMRDRFRHGLALIGLCAADAGRGRRLGGVNQRSYSTAAPAPSRRERRIYWIYGLLAAGFSYYLLGWIALRFGRYMVASYQAVGFLVFCGVLMVFFRQSLMRVLARPMAWFTSLTARLPGIRPTVLVSLLIALSAICWYGRMELKLSAESRIMPVRNAEVRAEVEGLIAEVFVDEGDDVHPGDPIARLDDEVYVAQLRKLEAEIGEARASLKMLQAGARSEEIELAQRELQTAQTRADHAAQRFCSARKLHDEQILKSQATIDKLRHQLASAEAELEWVRQLVAQRAGSLKELRDAESMVVLRQMELKEAQADLAVLSADDLAQFREAMVVAERTTEEPRARLELLLAGTRPELLEATQAKIAALDAQRRHVEEQIRLLRITSPIAGVVTTHRLKEKVGQLVERGQLIGSVHAVKTVTVEIALPEQEIADVCVGQRVILKARAYPRESFEGHVTGIAPIAGTQEELHAGKTILVTAQLNNSAGLLRSEMTGNAKIYCGERRILDIITRRFVRYLRVEFWSWW